MDLEIVTALCLMPAAMVIAAQSFTFMICVFAILLLSLITYYYKNSRSKFFLGWGVTTFLFLLAVFELEVVPYLEILFSENFCLMCFVGAMFLCFLLVRYYSLPAPLFVNQSERFSRNKCEVCSFMQPARTVHCEICGHCVLKQDHHNIWLDTCIGSRNQLYYVGGLIFLLISCIYSSNLTLTTICHPTLLAGMFLMPDDCSDVFGGFHIAICFVSAVYTLMIAVYCFFLLLVQLYLVCYNATYHEWKEGQVKLYSNGLRKNLIGFWYGYH